MGGITRKIRRSNAKRARVGATAPIASRIEEKFPEKGDFFQLFGPGWRVPGLYTLADGPASLVPGEIKIRVVTPEDLEMKGGEA